MSLEVDSAKLRQRVEGLSLIQTHLQLSLDNVLHDYVGSYFKGTIIDKENFFRECLALKLSGDSEGLLLEKCKLNFHRDARSAIEYGLDLVFGWLSEDLLLDSLRMRGFNVELSGEDRRREFLPSGEIGTSPDFCIVVNGERRPLEIVLSWNQYWEKTDTWDIRESKFRHLTRLGEESLCLGVELPKLQGFFIDMRDAKNACTKRPNPAWGYKNCYTLTGIRAKLRSINLVLEGINQTKPVG
jgi:hypothetical protein